MFVNNRVITEIHIMATFGSVSVLPFFLLIVCHNIKKQWPRAGLGNVRSAEHLNVAHVIQFQYFIYFMYILFRRHVKNQENFEFIIKITLKSYFFNFISTCSNLKVDVLALGSLLVSNVARGAKRVAHPWPRAIMHNIKPFLACHET